MSLFSLLFAGLAIYFAGWPRDFTSAAICVTLAALFDLTRRVGDLQEEVRLLRTRIQTLKNSDPFRGL